MNLLKFLGLLILAASLSLLLSGTVKATDHPWDDSSTDTSETLSADDLDPSGNNGTGDEGHTGESIVWKLRTWIADFWHIFFSGSKAHREDGKIQESSKENVKRPNIFVRVRLTK